MGGDTGEAVSRETGICLKTTHCVSSVCSGDAANHRGVSDLQCNASQHYTNMSRLAVYDIAVTSVGLYKYELHVSSLCVQHTPNSLLMFPLSDTALQSYKYQKVKVDINTIYPECLVFSGEKSLDRNQLVTEDRRGLCLCIFLYFLTHTACLSQNKY